MSEEEKDDENQEESEEFTEDKDMSNNQEDSEDEVLDNESKITKKEDKSEDISERMTPEKIEDQKKKEEQEEKSKDEEEPLEDPSEDLEEDEENRDVSEDVEYVSENEEEREPDIGDELTDEEDEKHSKLLDDYKITERGVPVRVEIKKLSGRYTPIYSLKYPQIPFLSPNEEATIKSNLLREFKPSALKYKDMEEYKNVQDRFESAVYNSLRGLEKQLSARDTKLLAVDLMNGMIGLGKIEIMLKDENLEEICVNQSKKRIYVYHKKYGWLKSNVTIGTEKEIRDLAEKIASRFGKELTVAKPVLDDAILVTGDRVTATLQPISSKGNTITIRKFRRAPWTIVDMISEDINTMSPEVAALIWMSIENEMNLMVAGGTASGKTSLLNSLLLFVPPSQRIVSIEDVREINLPDHLHWVPMAARESAGEKADKITVLRLMLAALRMRPDRIVLGEVRTTEEAQTLFEAADTGHSTYSTLHANRADGIFRRLLNPPINIPESMLGSLHLAIVQRRNKRTGARRTIEVAEIIVEGEGADVNVSHNILYSWDAETDKLNKVGESKRLIEEIKFSTGLSEEEINQDIKEKEKILRWMLDENIRGIREVGNVIRRYYENKEKLLNDIKSQVEIGLSED